MNPAGQLQGPCRNFEGRLTEPSLVQHMEAHPCVQEVNRPLARLSRLQQLSRALHHLRFQTPLQVVGISRLVMHPAPLTCAVSAEGSPTRCPGRSGMPTTMPPAPRSNAASTTSRMNSALLVLLRMTFRGAPLPISAVARPVQTVP